MLLFESYQSLGHGHGTLEEADGRGGGGAVSVDVLPTAVTWDARERRDKRD